jgi:predicted ferric reductase
MPSPKRRITALLIWAALGIVMAAPVVLATFSPYLEYRNLPYIVGGFAGIACLSLFVIQPLLAWGYLPGPGRARERRWHRWVGAAIVVAVALHVGGLYLTSAPDTLDALLLVAPTPFSVYGVQAMWGVVVTAVLVVLRHRLGVRYATWYLIHNGLALVVVVGTVIHALQIEGAMEIVSKWLLCLAALTATGATLLDLRVVKPLMRFRRTIEKPTSK